MTRRLRVADLRDGQSNRSIQVNHRSSGWVTLETGLNEVQAVNMWWQIRRKHPDYKVRIVRKAAK